MTGRRLLLVHAHPDDETINNGATMARYAAEGVQVTLVTCTQGEEGEVLVPDLEHLASHIDDRLGNHRHDELAAAMALLGVTDHRYLGGPGRYRDSGMIGTPQNDRPDNFWNADLREAATELVSVIREVQPQVLVTYDDFGGYGHPDHIQAHRVAMYGASLAAAESFRPDLGAAWDVSKIYWTTMPVSVLQAGIDAMKAIGSNFFGLEKAEDFPFAVADDLVSTFVDGGDHVEAKMAAMKAHATQITTDGPFFALSNSVGMTVFAREWYRLVKGSLAPGDDGLEDDLFAGLAGL